LIEVPHNHDQEGREANRQRNSCRVEVGVERRVEFDLARWSHGTKRNLVERLCGYLATLCAGGEGRAAMARWESAGVTFDHVAGRPVHSPLELARTCHSGDGPGSARRVVEELLTLAPDDRFAALCVLAALGPGLTRLVRLAETWGLEPAEAESNVLSAAWEAIVGGASCAAGVIGCARAEVRNAARRERRRCGRELSTPSMPDTEFREFEDGSGLALLVEAVDAGVLSQRQASVLWAVRAYAVTVADVAEALGCSSDAVRKSVQRSERALRAFLEESSEEDRR
jgi:DNA-directed RNA polymerase specialized sigma24 family protein